MSKDQNQKNNRKTKTARKSSKNKNGIYFNFYFGKNKYIGLAESTTDSSKIKLRVWYDKKPKTGLMGTYSIPVVINGWEMFLQEAKFEDILNSIRKPYQALDFLKKAIKDKNTLRNILEIDPNKITLAFLCEEGLVDYISAATDKNFLKNIREIPDLLTLDPVLKRFLELIKFANWVPGKERQKQINLLKKYFIPTDTFSWDEVNRIQLVLLKKLAFHLSSSINRIPILYNDRRFTPRVIIRKSNATPDFVVDIKRNIKEHLSIFKRVKYLSDEDLKILITDPGRYAIKIFLHRFLF